MTRIIAGEARGRRLEVPQEGTRPTSDRAREGLFSSLTMRWSFGGSKVLDLFAGSGALGLEAASRGAEEVVMVESNPAAVRVIERNLQVVGHPRASVRTAKASAYLAAAPRGYFDLVLADPPYEFGSVEELLAALEPALADRAMVVIERHRDAPATQWPQGFEPTPQKLKKRTFGIARMDMAIFDRADLTVGTTDDGGTKENGGANDDGGAAQTSEEADND